MRYQEKRNSIVYTQHKFGGGILSSLHRAYIVRFTQQPTSDSHSYNPSRSTIYLAITFTVTSLAPSERKNRFQGGVTNIQGRQYIYTGLCLLTNHVINSVTVRSSSKQVLHVPRSRIGYCMRRPSF